MDRWVWAGVTLRHAGVEDRSAGRTALAAAIPPVPEDPVAFVHLVADDLWREGEAITIAAELEAASGRLGTMARVVSWGIDLALRDTNLTEQVPGSLGQIPRLQEAPSP